MVPQQQRRRRRRAALVRTAERRVIVARGSGGFGFTIAGQRPCIVSAVAAGGPAERAGLRAGDALLAVDGTSVARAPHASVARMVAAAPGAISLSVALRESAPTDTEDTEPEERARTRRRYPPPRRRPQQAMMHHPGKLFCCHAAPSTSGVNEILQNLSRAQLTPNHVARLECRAVVGYLGTIETPQATAAAAPSNVRNAVKKLRQERRPATPVLLSVLPNALLLRRPTGQVLAQYTRERIVYAGCGSEADRRYFGLVTAAEISGIETEASHSCHVFAVDSRMAEHEAHINRARDFQIVCTRDPVAERCLEFPPSAEYVVGVIRGMYSLPPDDCGSPNLQQISKLAVKGDSPALGNFSRCNRPVFRAQRDRRPCRQEDQRIDVPEFVANSPQPSNHSEVTTTSSNSDSGIGFHNDCRNIADRILVVEFAGQQPPPSRFRQEMPRRPMGLVGCSSFDNDGSFLSNTTPVVDGFGGQGRPLNLDDVILNANDLPRPVGQRTDDDTYNYNNLYGNLPSSSRSFHGVVYDQVYTENEGHYELVPQELDDIDRVAETFNSVEIYEDRTRHPPDYHSNESVENVTVVSGRSAASADSVSVYSSRSHEEARPRRRHLQASLDDMLVLGLRDPPPPDKDDGKFLHPGNIKCKFRKSKPLNILSKTKNILTGKESRSGDKAREREGEAEGRRRALSASAGDVSAEQPDAAPLPAAASEPDLRDQWKPTLISKTSNVQLKVKIQIRSRKYLSS
ncbi:Regulator of G-protein signaling loco [Papilio xuthus]|uniref:Regulator of G-protein signaling loco n=1 Tax=Papilio xuthus TaxID=66420 RepID=A0A0N0P9W6_PAPXU|nr:Regulator of G-protein signaling loco [Papilio xuthus]